VRNVLLVEPDYKSKFPPLGLMRISTYHKQLGDKVVFKRGMSDEARALSWHKIYISSLFTYELRRTVETAKYYQKSVESSKDIFIGGIGATLMPHYVRANGDFSIIEGQIDCPNKLEPGSPNLVTLLPDYDLLSCTEKRYTPSDAYFCRATIGCIRKCTFCAVPKLEPKFRKLRSLSSQVKEIIKTFGEKQDLIILDNNILAWEQFDKIIDEIKDLGFEKGSKRERRKRAVDFNQGLDARLLTEDKARLLSKICLKPVRLAFDTMAVEKHYRKAVIRLAKNGFYEFTNYLLFNCEDSPEDFFYRMSVNLELSEELGIRVTGFPMKYSPVDSVVRRYISPKWKWKYLRGIQCVLLATHGMVSPNPEFFAAAFGNNYEEFLNILSMPERYIIHRNAYKEEAKDWLREYKKLSESERNALLDVLAEIVRTKNKIKVFRENKRFLHLLNYYYPDVKG